MTAARSSAYEIFVSYSRKDNAGGLVTAIRDHIVEDHRRFSTEPLRIFLDHSEIRDLDDWRHRILGALRSSKVLLICLSPNYYASAYCRWEFDEYLHRQVHHLMGSDTLAQVYFVEVPGSPEQENAAGWYGLLRRTNYTDIRPWFPEGALALRREEVRQRMAALGQSLWERLQRARRAEEAPGNLRRQTPYFVGRTEELRRLHEQLGLGAVGVVTALHGLGGQGKTELAVAYAHAWADSYLAGLWALGAEGKSELLPLIGELAWDRALGFTPTEAERNDAALLGRGVLAHLEQRVHAIREQDPDRDGGALLLLDNVTEPGLLSSSQLATLPGAEWLRIVATTRLAIQSLPQRLFLLPVDSLDEESALALVRDHQPPRDERGTITADAAAGEPAFASQAEEEAARQIVRALGGFTLAVEQAAVYLGLHPEVAPSAFLAGLRARGLSRADELVDDLRSEGREGEILHRQKQLGLILETTLSALDAPALTALRFAALLLPDIVPWPWLSALVAAHHPELARHAPDDPDPWVTSRRRLAGLRLLTSGDRPELARIHRLVAAHLGQQPDTSLESALEAHLVARAWSIYFAQPAPEEWELDALLAALPHRLAERPTRDLANAAVFLSDKVLVYRNLPSVSALVTSAHSVLARLAASDPGNAAWQRDLSVSYDRLGDLSVAQGDLPAALRSFTEGLRIAERLAASDPGNAAWQRDLWVSCWRLADLCERTGKPEEAHDWWRRAYDTLATMKRRGLHISPTDEGFLVRLRAKVQQE